MTFWRILTRSKFLIIAARQLRWACLVLALGAIGGTSFGVEYIHRFAPGDLTRVSGVAADGAGNVYVCGDTQNRAAIPGAMPIGPGNPDGSTSDGFIMKFAADGKLAAATIFGGGKADEAVRMALGPSGSVVVYGRTLSEDFPTTNGLQPNLAGKSDVFVCKFDASCTNLLFSTLWGGIEVESATALAVDGLGDIVIAGTTDSEDFLAGEVLPPGSGIYGRLHPFVAKVAGDGSGLRYAFRFGGTGHQQISSVAADAEGNAFLTGGTSSHDFPTLNAIQDSRPLINHQSAFVAKLAPNGELGFSTFLAGNGYDQAEAIALNDTGEIFVAGWTGSDIFPALSVPLVPAADGSWYRAFLARLTPQATDILSTNFYGYTTFDRFSSLAVTPDGDVFAAGTLQPYRGIPMVAGLRKDGSTSLFFDRLECGAEWVEVTSMALGAAGSVVLAGQEWRTGFTTSGSYVGKYSPPAASVSSGPKVKIISPIEGSKVAPKQPVYLSAAVVGATASVASVKFYVGRRLIGTATNVPYAVQWTNSTRGVYNLKAVANVDGQAVPSCVVRLTVTSPRNDSFARRIRLHGEKVDVLVDTVGATQEPGEELLSFALGSVWYSWTAPRDGVFSFAVGTEVGSDPYFQVYTGTRIRDLVVVDDSLQQEEKTLSVRRGTTYQIRVSGNSQASPGHLQIRAVAPPANDHFANAFQLNGETVSVSTTTRHATTEPGEFPGYSGYLGFATVWYAWTAPLTGLYLVALDGQDRSPSVRVHTGNSISNLTSIGQEIWGATNGVAIYAQAGTKYFISLSNGGTNSCVLTVAPHSAPPNDNFADRLTIPPGTHSVMGSLIGATSELGEPATRYFLEPSVWWSWRPETAGVYWIEVVPATHSAAGTGVRAINSEGVRAFAGDNLAILTPVTGSQTVAPLLLHASPATTYQLVVTGDMALFALNIRSVTSPGNDNFNAALPLQGSPAIKSGTTVGATVESGEPSHAPSNSIYRGDDSVWYRWTAPSNGVYAFFALAARSLDIYEGNTLGTLLPVASNASSHVLQLVGGVEYRLAVTGGNGFRIVIRPGSRPTNDDFSNPQTVTGLYTKFGGPMTDATVESGEPSHDGSRRSIWFSWTAPASGTYLIRFQTSVSGGIAVYTGDSLGGLVRVGVSGGYAGYELPAEEGVTYRIAVAGYSFTEDYGQPDVLVELRYCPPPRNDDFGRRIRLTGLAPSVTASNVGATLQSGEPRNGAAGLGHTVWWTWRASRNGRVTFQVESAGSGNYFSGVIGVYTGTSVTALTPISPTNTSSGVLNLPVQKGRDYHIVIDSASGLSGRFRLGLRYTSVPPNDSFAGRIVFTDQAVGTLEGASRETDEPGYELDPYGASAWWTWTAPATGRYEFSFGMWGSANGIDVFKGDALGTLVPVDAEPSYTTAYRQFHATAGTVYVVRVSGLGTGGQYTLRASFTPPPVNDHFADRILLVGTNFTVGSSNLAATAELDEPHHDGLPANRSVWWTWTAPATGMVRIGLPSYTGHRISVYTGVQLGALTSVREGNGAVVFSVEAGQEYQIAFDLPSYYSGSDTFAWSLSFHPPPANDDFENRLTLIGEPSSAAGTALGASLEAGEPTLPFSPGYSVWWRWIAPETGRYTFAVSGSVATVALAVYSGSDLANLTKLAGNDPGFNAVNMAISGGTELAISIDPDLERAGHSGSFVLKISRTPVPGNDDFADAALLAAASAEGNLEGSSREPAEPGFQEDPDGTSIWWRYTPPGTGWYSIIAATELSSSYPYPPFPPNVYSRASVAVFSGSNIANLSAVPSRGYSRPTSFRLEGGTEYSIQVSGRNRWFGPLRLSVAPLTGPSNDQFASAQAILSDNTIVTGSNDLASVEVGEPARKFGSGNSVWWKWTAVSNGVFAITRSNSTAFAYLDVYTGDSVSNLVRVPEAPFGRGIGEYLFRASAGITYYISAVTTGYEGAIRLAFARVSPPPNDDFVNRAALSGSHVSLITSNFNATAESEDPLSDPYAGQTVWWKWTAPASGYVTLNTEADEASFDLGVFRGDSIGDLAIVELFSTPPLEFYATEGEEYVIGITTSFSEATQFTLSLDLIEPDPAPSVPFNLPLPQGIGVTDKPLTVETSTNLVDWAPFSTLAPGEKEFRFVPNQTEPQRFFRVR